MVWKRNDPEPTPTPSPNPSTPSRPQGAGRGAERAVIGASITVEGDVKGQEDLTILGRVQGTVDVQDHTVTVGQSGKVKADLYGKLIVVEGQVQGNLYGKDQLILRATADVQGNLTAPRVALDDGAQFKGSIDMEPVRGAKSGSSGGTSDRSKSGTGSGTGGSGSGSGTGSGSGSASGKGSDDKQSKGPSGSGSAGTTGGSSGSGSGSSGSGS